MVKKNNTSFKEWSKSLENMDFDHYSMTIRDKILEGNLDKLSKDCFKVCFDYVSKLNKEGKPLDLNLLKIHLEQVNDFKNLKYNEIITILILLSYCGFNIKLNQ